MSLHLQFRTATVLALTDVDVLVLERWDFVSMPGSRGLLTTRCSLQARAATVLALTDVNVLVLQREDFDALLGPLQRLLEVQIASYGSSKADKPLQASKVSAIGCLLLRLIVVPPHSDESCTNKRLECSALNVPG